MNIQEWFDKFHGDLTFGIIISKIENKFYRYCFLISIIYDLDILIDLYMKDKALQSFVRNPKTPASPTLLPSPTFPQLSP